METNEEKLARFKEESLRRYFGEEVECSFCCCDDTKHGWMNNGANISEEWCRSCSLTRCIGAHNWKKSLNPECPKDYCDYCQEDKE